MVWLSASNGHWIALALISVPNISSHRIDTDSFSAPLPYHFTRHLLSSISTDRHHLTSTVKLWLVV